MKYQQAIRRSILKKLAPRAKALWTTMPQYAKPAAPKVRQSIARNTPQRAKQNRIYRARVKEYLALPKNRNCVVCIILAAKGIFKGDKILTATQVHHRHGRRGELLLAERYWVPVSDVGHRWVHSHPQQARELGLLAPIGQWNSAPK